MPDILIQEERKKVVTMEVALHLKASFRFFGLFDLFVFFLRKVAGGLPYSCIFSRFFFYPFVILIFSCLGSSIPDLGQSVTE